MHDELRATGVVLPAILSIMTSGCVQSDPCGLVPRLLEDGTLGVTSSVQLTDIPPVGSFDNLAGRTTGVSPDDHRVLVYICVNGTWWVKPTLAEPLTPIGAECTWETDITTGGIDETADMIAAYLVPRDFQPELHVPPSISEGDFPSVVFRRAPASGCETP